MSWLSTYEKLSCIEKLNYLLKELSKVRSQAGSIKQFEYALAWRLERHKNQWEMEGKS